MQGTHMAMSLLIFRLVLILVLHLVLLMLCLTSFIDLTIAHMVLVHERMALCQDALVRNHILIVVVAFLSHTLHPVVFQGIKSTRKQ
jgi:hypothetical protein